MIDPTKLEVLSALLRVLDRQDADRLAAAAERAACVADDESVLSAISQAENTWERLHAHFPDAQWPALKATLDGLQRAERIHIHVWLGGGQRFNLGARKRPWLVSP